MVGRERAAWFGRDRRLSAELERESLLERNRIGPRWITHAARCTIRQPGGLPEDPIGLAGGLNLYGFAGADPVNFSDPFGLRLEIKGARLARQVRSLRDNDPEIDFVFRQLEDDPRLFEIVSSEALPTSSLWRGVGLAGWTFARSAPPQFSELVPFMEGAVAMAVVSLESASYCGTTPDMVAFHEALHLLFLQRQGKSFPHGSCYFVTESPRVFRKARYVSAPARTFASRAW